MNPFFSIFRCQESNISAPPSDQSHGYIGQRDVKGELGSVAQTMIVKVTS